MFPLFPRLYNNQYDQFNQLQDPKIKFFESKNDYEGGGYLNNSIVTPSFVKDAFGK